MSSHPTDSWCPEALADIEERTPVRPLNLWKPSQFLEWQEPAGSHLLLPAYVSLGELTTIIGQGGLGKSRLAGLWLPICQITGRDWCGLRTGGEPQKWLIIGNENGIGRIKADLTRIFTNLTEDQRERVDEHLRIQAICSFEDADLSLGNLDTQARIEETLKVEKPGAVILDPLNSFAQGDISKPAEMRDAVRLLLSLVRRVVPNAAVVLLHHSRTGRANIAQGVGFDAANFATGGKTLYAMARCQINLMPGKAEDDTCLVLACAKANNCERFETRGLRFDPVSFLYRVDDDFNLESWKADVEGRKGKANPCCTPSEVASAVAEGIAERGALIKHLEQKFRLAKRTAERRITESLDAGAIHVRVRGVYRVGLAVGGRSK